ncbi:MAG: peptidylprolyl isomerase [Pseudomonadota bacterium]
MNCSVRDLIMPKPRQVSVNGIVVPRDAIARETQNHPSDTPIKAWSEAARSLVVRELLLQEAKRIGVDASPLTDADSRRETEDEALIRGLIEQEIVIPVADEETCRRYYDRNRKRFMTQDIYCAAHILFAANAADPQRYETAHALARAVLTELQLAPHRFEELARVHSACPSARQGGNLGQIVRGQSTPDFERAMMALSPGTLTAEPVPTCYGFHIIRLDRRIEGRPLPFETVADRIAEYLTESARRRATAQYIARLVWRAEIAGIEMPNSAEYRVN